VLISLFGDLVNQIVVLQAIKDARENAQINGRANKCRFVCGPAEDTFRSLIVC
jgi:tRNA/tmRNA/rRNA uracil-C5-methylase (TrmA/RlmC/RlmD family)